MVPLGPLHFSSGTTRQEIARSDLPRAADHQARARMLFFTAERS